MPRATTFRTWDDYFIPGTSVLRNKFTAPGKPYGETDPDKLRTLEEAYAHSRIQELAEHPIEGRFDYDHMKAVHGAIFQDAYEWAGQERVAPDGFMTKDGHAYYGAGPALTAAAEAEYAKLAGKDFLRGVEPKAFVDQLAESWGEINVIHSFREGNTRSQFVFFSQLAEQAGYRMDATQFAPGAPLRDAFVEARFHSQDTGRNDRLAAVLGQAVIPFEPGSRSQDAGASPEHGRSNVDAWRGVELAHGGFPMPGTGLGHSTPPAASPGTTTGHDNIENRRGERRGRTVNVIGYARVSEREQNPAAQEAELRAAGAGKVFVDRGESNRIADRPQWLACLDFLREGDTLLVRRLDRLGGSERIIIETLNDLERRGVNIKRLTEPVIDTTAPMGRALYGIVAVFVQLRVDTIRENTKRGLAYAKAQGRVGGRPSVMSPERVEAAVRMRAAGDSIAQIARTFGVGASSVSRALAKHDEQTQELAS